MNNRKAGPDLWAIIRNRWDESVEMFPPMTFRRLVEGVTSLSQPEVAADVKGFFAETPVPSATKALAQRLELLDANVDARSREAKSVGAWLQQFS